MKTCICCRQQKPVAEFRPAARMKDGRCGKCRACEAAYSRRYREQGPEVVLSTEEKESVADLSSHWQADKYAKRRARSP